MVTKVMKIVAGMIRRLLERRRNRKRKERDFCIFFFFFFFFFSRRQKHDARLSDFFNKHNSLSPFPRERALDNIIDNNNNSNGRSVL